MCDHACAGPVTGADLDKLLVELQKPTSEYVSIPSKWKLITENAHSDGDMYASEFFHYYCSVLPSVCSLWMHACTSDFYLTGIFYVANCVQSANLGITENPRSHQIPSVPAVQSKL